MKFAHNLMNLQAGFMIDERWTPFLNKLFNDKQGWNDYCGGARVDFSFRKLKVQLRVAYAHSDSQCNKMSFEYFVQNLI